MGTNDDLLDIAVEAARSAGGLLREVFRTGVKVATKRDFHDPVTEHDVAAEELIRSVIGRRAPDSVVVGEEGGASGSGEVTWYVDPIDGTANFAAGIAFFCVSVAAAVRGELVAGVIYDPVRDQLFTAGDGGAHCDGRPLVSAGPRVDREALLLTSYPTPGILAREGEAALACYGRLVSSFAGVQRLGSAALKLAHVAAGWAHACYGPGASPWDVAAGALLVRGAGGRYLGDPLTVSPYLATVAGFDLDGSALAELIPRSTK